MVTDRPVFNELYKVGTHILNVRAGLFIYMYVKLVKLFALANEACCAFTVLSLDFGKGDAF